MKDTIYLYVTKSGVERMRKSLGNFSRHEVPIKLSIEVPDGAFKTPVMEQHVFVDEWDHGIDIEDVQFKKQVITKEEAETIRHSRLQKMKTILEAQGFKVEEPEVEDGVR